MNNIELYIGKIEQLINEIKQNELSNIHLAAELISNSIANNGWLYVFGTGHSHMVAEEFFYRAGGLARIRPIFEPNLMLHESAVKSTELERQLGYAEKLLKQHNLSANDTLLIASNSGRNAVPIELAIGARNIGCSVIALTSLKHSQIVSSRHQSNKKLYQLADIVIDNRGEYGDACITYSSGMVSPTSSVINSMIINALVADIAQISEANNLDIEFFASSNSETGEEHNKQLITKYSHLVREL